MKRKKGNPKLWSVTHIRDPRYPHIQVRITELRGTPFLYLGRQIDGKPRYSVLEPKVTRAEPAMGTHVSYDGTGQIVGKGGAAAGVYLVFVQLIRSQRLSSRLPPDTILGWVPALEGKGQLVGQDWTFTCTSFERETGFEGCAPELKEPAAHFQVLGWLRFMNSATDKRRNE